MDERLNSLLTELLGQPDNPNSQWVYFECPFCGKKGKQKQKFAFNINTLIWKCWVCKQHGNNLFSLIRRLGKWDLKDRVQSTVEKIKPFKPKKNLSKIGLPKEYFPLSDGRDFVMKKRVMKYLRARGITQYQIAKYDIGFCQDGRYENRIIIPSFDQNNSLNYFTARSIQSDQDLKYLNPKFQKDLVIIFQNMINWKFPVILTQGMFDAITVNFNAVPLMGKTVPDKLLEKLLFYDSDVYISLDNDAQQDQNQIMKKMNNTGLNNIYFLRLKEKDPNQMGRNNYWQNLLTQAKRFTVNSSLDMMKERVGLMSK